MGVRLKRASGKERYGSPLSRSGVPTLGIPSRLRRPSTGFMTRLKEYNVVLRMESKTVMRGYRLAGSKRSIYPALPVECLCSMLQVMDCLQPDHDCAFHDLGISRNISQGPRMQQTVVSSPCVSAQCRIITSSLGEVGGGP